MGWCSTGFPYLQSYFVIRHDLQTPQSNPLPPLQSRDLWKWQSIVDLSHREWFQRGITNVHLTNRSSLSQELEICKNNTDTLIPMNVNPLSSKCVEFRRAYFNVCVSTLERCIGLTVQVMNLFTLASLLLLVKTWTTTFLFWLCTERSISSPS